MACQAMGEQDRALGLFTSAADTQQSNALASFQRGTCLNALGRSREAVEELRRAQCLAPREACVHFQLGRAHAGVGDSQQALLHFTTAMDLCGSKDSKDHQLVVAAQAELLRTTNGPETPSV